MVGRPWQGTDPTVQAMMCAVFVWTFIGKRTTAGEHGWQALARHRSNSASNDVHCVCMYIHRQVHHCWRPWLAGPGKAQIQQCELCCALCLYEHAQAGALLLESVAGKLWLLHGSSGSDEKLVLHEQLLRRANTLAACMRLQLNSTVANFSTKTSEMGSKSKTEAAAEGCSAAAAAAGAHTGVHARHQPSSPQAQAASTNASASGSQAHGVLGSEGSSGGRSSGGDADDVLALRMDVASVFSAACRLVRALHPLLSESQ
eukprot:1161303-Pelagomonas_calceolata.AAC.1